MPMRVCLFCSGPANSLEDAWPRWITNQFKAPRSAELQAERHGVTLKPWQVYQPKLTVRCVCQTCNNGWMSQLEVQTKRFLQPLLIGQPCSLDSTAQSTIALWSVKTAMVLEALDQPHLRAYTQPECAQLRIQGAIPWRTSIWLATSLDSTYFMSSKHRHLDTHKASQISGVSITMAFAHVVLQVFTIRLPRDVGPTTRVTANVRRGPWEQATIQIWPVQSTQVSWPPSSGFNGLVGLDSFAQRFAISAIDEDANDTLPV